MERKRVKIKIERKQLPLITEVAIKNSGLSSAKTVVDAIRLLWLQGKADSDVIGFLGLNKNTWDQCLKEMDVVPRSREKSLRAFRRYQLEHEKYKLRQEDKLQTLSDLRDTINREALPGDRKDVVTIRRIIKDMTDLEEKIRLSESHLLGIKSQLGLLILPVKKDDSSEKKNLFSATNVRDAWRKRMEMAKDITNVTTVTTEEAEVEASDSS